MSEAPQASEPTACVLVPLKSFSAAKARLAAVLGPEEREDLARSMAEQVLRAAAPLEVLVVCDDERVADWARQRGAGVEWTPGLDLSGAVQLATRRCAERGVRRVVVAHGDLPAARDLASLAPEDSPEVLLVADRHGTGSNVVSLPSDTGFRFAYGPGSFDRHRAEAERLGLPWRLVRAEHLSWDVDEPEDLDPVPGAGTRGVPR